MATLIFDIKTVGEKWESFDDATRESLSRMIRTFAKNKSEESALLEDLRSNLRFTPFTGSIISIGLYDQERKAGAVYYVGNGDEGDVPQDEFILKQRTEKEMLEDFWEGARSYDTFVTFNGRAFDVPFLIHRSVALQVRPSCDLMEGRYLSMQKSLRHIDLIDQLSFYGAMHKKGTLHLYCRSYGIESPEAEIKGDDVEVLFSQKKFRDIAKYNAREVTATAQLYEKWLEYLAPVSVRDIDFL